MLSRADRVGTYPTFCKIPPGRSTKRHSHFENEIFYIIEGKGEIRVNEEIRPVEKGHLIRLSPFSQHELRNTGVEALVFLSVYSEDFELEAIPHSAVITAAPPTPNGPLHLDISAGLI